MNKLYDLDLPVIKTKMSPPSIRSFEEIEQWLDEMYDQFYDAESYAKEKDRLSVNKMFTL
jgi:hypothetical protein